MASDSGSEDFIVETSGTVRSIYSDAVPLSRLGVPAIRRASHVEPTASGQWTADLAPVDGPSLGPFDRRADALAAEVAWLRRHWLNTD